MISYTISFLIGLLLGMAIAIGGMVIAILKDFKDIFHNEEE